MTHTKKICLTLLLCLGANQSMQAFSWQSIKETIERQITNRSVIIPLIGCSLVGIMSYYFYKSFRKPIHNTEYNVTHINVLRQQEPATCGYHAIKNALAALRIHENNLDWNTICNERQNEFNDQNHFDAHLQLWKNIVVQERKKNVLKNKIQNLLRPLAPTGSLYREIFDNIGFGKADYLISNFLEQKNDDGEFYVIDNKSIIELIQLGALDKKKDWSQDKIKIEVPSLQTIDRLIIQSKTLSEEIIKTFTVLDEWLEGDEIIKLITQETNKKIADSNITVCDSIDQIELALAEPVDKPAEQKNKILNSIRAKWQQSNNCVHVFIVGTMDEHNREIKGHWFTVIAQKKDGKTSFFTMDSLGTNRTKDKRVKKIIRSLMK